MELTESQVAMVRKAFRSMNRGMLLMWRLGLGRMLATRQGGYVLVLTTTGRKSGMRRLVPLNFEEEGASVYCLAGFGKRTHWLLNLQADPTCELWLPDGRRIIGHAQLVTDEDRRVDLIRKVLVRAGFATKLAEPGLDPLHDPDETIAGLGQSFGNRYEVVEIQLGDPVSGPGGPGDLTWIWPTAGIAAVVGWLLLRRR